MVSLATDNTLDFEETQKKLSIIYEESEIKKFLTANQNTFDFDE